MLASRGVWAVGWLLGPGECGHLPLGLESIPPLALCHWDSQGLSLPTRPPAVCLRGFAWVGMCRYAAFCGTPGAQGRFPLPAKPVAQSQSQSHTAVHRTILATIRQHLVISMHIFPGPSVTGQFEGSKGFSRRPDSQPLPIQEITTWYRKWYICISWSLHVPGAFAQVPLAPATK